jgi:hypothetical protein
MYVKEFKVKKNMKKLMYFNSLLEDVCIKKTTCCFITRKFEDSIVSIGVEKLNSISNKDSPKKKKNIQKLIKKYDVSRDVIDVN